MQTRHTHTTKTEKAKCLAYRDGKRCGRVAKFVITFTSPTGHHTQSVCAECAKREGATISQESPKGFCVQSGGGFSGMVSRRYIEIGE